MRTSRIRSRGSFGQWQTYDRRDGAVREMSGADAVTLAVIDGGGCLTPTDQPRPRARRRSRR